MHVNPEIAELLHQGIIAWPGAMDYLPRLESVDPTTKARSFGELNGSKMTMAMDALVGTQPTLVTSPNSAIPALLTTYIDPKLIEVLLTPMKSEVIYGVAKKGDWNLDTAMFPMVEMTGEAAVYNDFNENGRSDANVQWPQRQNAHVQTFTEWGDRELDRMAEARIDWAARKNLSSANTLARFLNLMNFYGWAGLQNYGGLNDPSLSAALTPATKAAGGTGWKAALPTEILADVQAMFAQLQTQTGSNLELDMPMMLALHSTSEVYLANTNSFGLTAMEMIRKVFPKIKIENAVQYLSGTTYSCQLIVEDIEGQRTCETVFSEKMRAHRVVMGTSSQKQKKSAGGFGTVIYRPVGIVSMAGL